MVTEMCKIAQAHNETNKPGANTFSFIDHKGFKYIPNTQQCKIHEWIIVVSYQLENADTNQIRITMGSNLIDFLEEVTVWPIDLDAAKIYGSVLRIILIHQGFYVSANDKIVTSIQQRSDKNA